jgi:hypothetical protein
MLTASVLTGSTLYLGYKAYTYMEGASAFVLLRKVTDFFSHASMAQHSQPQKLVQPESQLRWSHKETLMAALKRTSLTPPPILQPPPENYLSQTCTAWKSDCSIKLIRSGQELVLPVKEIAAGDTIVVETGEKVPVSGVITDGVALVKYADAQFYAFSTKLCAGQDQVKVNAGQWIHVNAIVLAGRIQILVAPLV